MKPIRVLLVDDSAQVREDLRLVLSLRGGIEVVGEASNGLEAVQRERSLRPDVIVMDLRMPGMDGVEAARVIKARHPSCRIVALTIENGEEQREHAIRAGIDAVVVKGIPSAGLLELICGEAPDDGEHQGGAR